MTIAFPLLVNAQLTELNSCPLGITQLSENLRAQILEKAPETKQEYSNALYHPKFETSDTILLDLFMHRLIQETRKEIVYAAIKRLTTHFYDVYSNKPGHHLDQLSISEIPKKAISLVCLGFCSPEKIRELLMMSQNTVSEFIKTGRPRLTPEKNFERLKTAHQGIHDVTHFDSNDWLAIKRAESIWQEEPLSQIYSRDLLTREDRFNEGDFRRRQNLFHQRWQLAWRRTIKNLELESALRPDSKTSLLPIFTDSDRKMIFDLITHTPKSFAIALEREWTQIIKAKRAISLCDVFRRIDTSVFSVRWEDSINNGNSNFNPIAFAWLILVPGFAVVGTPTIVFQLAVYGLLGYTLNDMLSFYNQSLELRQQLMALQMLSYVENNFDQQSKEVGGKINELEGRIGKEFVSFVFSAAVGTAVPKMLSQHLLKMSDSKFASYVVNRFQSQMAHPKKQYKTSLDLKEFLALGGHSNEVLKMAPHLRSPALMKMVQQIPRATAVEKLMNLSSLGFAKTFVITDLALEGVDTTYDIYKYGFWGDESPLAMLGFLFSHLHQ